MKNVITLLGSDGNSYTLREYNDENMNKVVEIKNTAGKIAYEYEYTLNDIITHQDLLDTIIEDEEL